MEADSGAVPACRDAVEFNVDSLSVAVERLRLPISGREMMIYDSIESLTPWRDCSMIAAISVPLPQRWLNQARGNYCSILKVQELNEAVLATKSNILLPIL